jgi:hypothetical protein
MSRIHLYQETPSRALLLLPHHLPTPEPRQRMNQLMIKPLRVEVNKSGQLYALFPTNKLPLQGVSAIVHCFLVLAFECLAWVEYLRNRPIYCNSTWPWDLARNPPFIWSVSPRICVLDSGNVLEHPAERSLLPSRISILDFEFRFRS